MDQQKLKGREILYVHGDGGGIIGVVLFRGVPAKGALPSGLSRVASGALLTPNEDGIDDDFDLDDDPVTETVL